MPSQEQVQYVSLLSSLKMIYIINNIGNHTVIYIMTIQSNRTNLSLISLCGRVLYKVGKALLSMESPCNQGNEVCLFPLQNVWQSNMVYSTLFVDLIIKVFMSFCYINGALQMSTIGYHSACSMSITLSICKDHVRVIYSNQERHREVCLD